MPLSNKPTAGRGKHLTDIGTVKRTNLPISTAYFTLFNCANTYEAAGASAEGGPWHRRKCG
jgi:hypothetical protein